MLHAGAIESWSFAKIGHIPLGDGHDFYVPNSEHHNSWYLPAGHGSSYINPAEARL
jgi:hypothetical protein